MIFSPAGGGRIYNKKKDEEGDQKLNKNKKYKSATQQKLSRKQMPGT